MVPARCGSTRASIAKTNRRKFTRFYPTMIVNTDGSTYWIKYKEPSYILKVIGLQIISCLMSDMDLEFQLG